MKLVQGDIILIPFPFTNLQSVKTRPSLVVLNDPKTQDVIILPITSKKCSYKEYCITNKHLSKGKLPITSYIRYNKITTLDISLVRRKVAQVKHNVLEEIINLFKKQF